MIACLCIIWCFIPVCSLRNIQSPNTPVLELAEGVPVDPYGSFNNYVALEGEGVMPGVTLCDRGERGIVKV